RAGSGRGRRRAPPTHRRARPHEGQGGRGGEDRGGAREARSSQQSSHHAPTVIEDLDEVPAYDPQTQHVAQRTERKGVLDPVADTGAAAARDELVQVAPEPVRPVHLPVDEAALLLPELDPRGPAKR